MSTAHSADVFGKIDSNGNNERDVFFMEDLMKSLTCESWCPVAVNHKAFGERLTRDSEIPFIR